MTQLVRGRNHAVEQSRQSATDCRFHLAVHGEHPHRRPRPFVCRLGVELVVPEVLHEELHGKADVQVLGHEMVHRDRHQLDFVEALVAVRQRGEIAEKGVAEEIVPSGAEQNVRQHGPAASRSVACPLPIDENAILTAALLGIEAGEGPERLALVFVFPVHVERVRVYFQVHVLPQLCGHSRIFDLRYLQNRSLQAVQRELPCGPRPLLSALLLECREKSLPQPQGLKPKNLSGSLQLNLKVGVSENEIQLKNSTREHPALPQIARGEYRDQGAEPQPAWVRLHIQVCGQAGPEAKPIVTNPEHPDVPGEPLGLPRQPFKRRSPVALLLGEDHKVPFALESPAAVADEHVKPSLCEPLRHGPSEPPRVRRPDYDARELSPRRRVRGNQHGRELRLPVQRIECHVTGPRRVELAIHGQPEPVADGEPQEDRYHRGQRAPHDGGNG
mmetsp:Transcript_97/g.207  ORF Transcript_97/g.207 Transcript_97/m.207 type:complete len:444 (-) Transcript_97:255-1586(-)